MQDWIIWIASTALVALISLGLGLLKDYNEVLAGLVALIMGIVMMIFAFPLMF